MFFSLKNMSAQSADLIEAPWEVSAKVPDHITTKDAYKKWVAHLATDYSFLSLFEGTSPNVRITKDNPPVLMHGLIVDYDYKNCTTDQLRGLVENPEGEFVPNYGSVSFSGGAKLYWLFEKPIPVGSQKMLTAFTARLHKELKLNKWLQGMDSGLLANTTQYYAAGYPWVEMGKRKLPHSLISFWMWEATKNLELWEGTREFAIPLEAVAEAVAEKYPNRWSGPFVEGARGIRFWDPSADNPTGAQVRKDGMMAYSGEQAFLSWEKIFGSQFVAQFAANKTEVVNNNTYYSDEESRFIMRDPESKQWLAWKENEFAQQLRNMNFSGKIAKGDTKSEIDRIEGQIRRLNRVSGYGSILHHAEGIVEMSDGKRFLNTGSRMPLAAMPHIGRNLEWSDGPARFPLIHEFMSTLFTDDNGEDPQGQMLHLMAWMKHAYECGVNLNPETGLVVYLAGPPDRGKSFFTEAIFGTLMGGCMDGSSYLVEDSKWTADLTASPVIFVADGSATADYKTVTLMTNKLKKLAANATLRSAQKYRKEGELPWFGRVIVSCNEDSESLSILPNMDISTKDKISLYKTSNRLFKFGRRRDMKEQLRKELPWFARFLLDWPYPEHLLSERTRFTLDAFHHRDLMMTALQQGPPGILSEFLIRVMKSLLVADPENRKHKLWRGTTAELYSILNEANGAFVREFKNVKALSYQLSHVYARKLLPLTQGKDAKTNSTLWTMPYDLLGEYNDEVPFDVDEAKPATQG